MGIAATIAGAQALPQHYASIKDWNQAAKQHLLPADQVDHPACAQCGDCLKRKYRKVIDALNLESVPFTLGARRAMWCQRQT